MTLMDIAESGDPLAESWNKLRTTTIMTYELGSLVRALVKAGNKKVAGDEKGMRAYLAEARVELADLLTQGHFLAEQMGLEIVEVEQEGEDRFRLRMKELYEMAHKQEKDATKAKEHLRPRH